MVRDTFRYFFSKLLKNDVGLSLTVICIFTLQFYSRCLHKLVGASGHRGSLQEIGFCRSGQKPQGESLISYVTGETVTAGII